MCNLKIEAMGRAGELPLETKMNEEDFSKPLDNLSGPAVRGEAVAVPQEFIDAVNGARGDLDAWLEVNNEADCCAIFKALLSPRAADAPSEPSELAKLLRDAIAQNVTQFPAQILAAADALDSQPTEPVAWMKPITKECTSAESKEKMAACEFGGWKEISKQYSIPLYELIDAIRESEFTKVQGD